MMKRHKLILIKKPDGKYEVVLVSTHAKKYDEEESQV